MLELKDITKRYTTGDFTQVALDHVSLRFRKSEFVAILGPSGSGKTTCLNVVGGLDHYDSGDLIINGRSTKNFKDAEWDAYRNNSVGFIFQSYNLIPHLSIVDHVEMGMTLSGVPGEQKHRKALDALERVGLKDHTHKKPNQLSGGQMQRVAIARALANDPDIILADEPTGALDTATSGQIMDLIKEIARDKLVIMVTHNPDLAEQYADRIVRFRDGCVVDDTNPYEPEQTDSGYSLKRTSMSFFTALKLSGKNIATKKWRTILTSFASSIGIIGIALILSLSSGFQIQIDQFQSDALSEFPIVVSRSAMSMDEDTMNEMRGQMTDIMTGNTELADSKEVILYDPEDFTLTHKNNFTKEYLDYIEAIDPAICGSVGYTRMVGMNLLRLDAGEAKPASMTIGISSGKEHAGSMTSMNEVGLATYPENLDGSSDSYLQKNYDLLAGAYPSDETGLVLVVDSQNRVDLNVFRNLGFDTDGVEALPFDQIIGTELLLVSNDDYYVKTPMGNFVPGSDYNAMAASDRTLSLKITGIVRLKADVKIGLLGSGLAYSDALVQRVIDREADSQIVQAQRQSDQNVITMEPMDKETKESTLTYLGGDATPFIVFLYPKDFESKEAVLAYLDDYNSGRAEEDTVVYTDLAKSITDMSGSIMDAITLVLIAFAAISLIVSLIMIGIITYISVLERTKEIGVLRALGARKKDITRVFNAETFIIGACSGLIGIALAYLLTLPVNAVIYHMTELSNVAQLHPLHALLLVVISVTLTLIGGAFPAMLAAKKDPVEALRSE